MITLRSPAKVNLFLRVISRRPDGYHELASLFQAVSLFDNLTLQISDGKDRFICTGEHSLLMDDQNIIIQALQLFRKKTALDSSVTIELNKNIPLQAGLGGGSSNAATTLWGLNELFGRPVSLPKLKLWAAELGADVPFFLSTGTAYCTGKGDVMKEISLLRKLSKMVLTKPDFGMSTAAVYQHVDLTKMSQRDPNIDLDDFLHGNRCYYNDLEVPAFSISPELANFRKSLSAEHVTLSGSGSAFFCIGNNISLPSNTWSVEVDPISRTTDSWW